MSNKKTISEMVEEPEKNESIRAAIEKARQKPTWCANKRVLKLLKSVENREVKKEDSDEEKEADFGFVKDKKTVGKLRRLASVAQIKDMQSPSHLLLNQDIIQATENNFLERIKQLVNALDQKGLVKPQACGRYSISSTQLSPLRGRKTSMSTMTSISSANYPKKKNSNHFYEPINARNQNLSPISVSSYKNSDQENERHLKEQRKISNRSFQVSSFHEAVIEEEEQSNSAHSGDLVTSHLNSSSVTIKSKNFSKTHTEHHNQEKEIKEKKQKSTLSSESYLLNSEQLQRERAPSKHDILNAMTNAVKSVDPKAELTEKSVLFKNAFTVESSAEYRQTEDQRDWKPIVKLNGIGQSDDKHKIRPSQGLSNQPNNIFPTPQLLVKQVDESNHSDEYIDSSPPSRERDHKKSNRVKMAKNAKNEPISKYEGSEARDLFFHLLSDIEKQMFREKMIHGIPRSHLFPPSTPEILEKAGLHVEVDQSLSPSARARAFRTKLENAAGLRHLAEEYDHSSPIRRRDGSMRATVGETTTSILSHEKDGSSNTTISGKIKISSNSPTRKAKQKIAEGSNIRYRAQSMPERQSESNHTLIGLKNDEQKWKDSSTKESTLPSLQVKNSNLKRPKAWTEDFDQKSATSFPPIKTQQNIIEPANQVRKNVIAPHFLCLAFVYKIVLLL